ncbi:Uncharacterized protein Fot_35192 [Forsythia ovata]|uniref:Uncharacterized protein n=1 Tax=Forsythia ovata TaxID=205694 RepID=A0ABD1SMA0_9LAMI
MVKSKGQYVNIEFEIGINSKSSKRKTSTSGRWGIISNPDKRLPGKVLVSYSYDVIYDIREKLNDGCCNLNQLTDRIAKLELKQSEILAKQAEILSFQRDLKNQLNNLSGNVQSTIADFLNQMDKKFHYNIEEVVLNRQIVLYFPILETEDKFENNDFNNYNEFETEVQVEGNDGSQLKDLKVESQVQVEDNDGSQLKDFEVEIQIQYDREGKEKAVVCDKTNTESVHHGATEFEKIEENDDIIQIDDITPSVPRRSRTRKTAAVKKKYNDNNKILNPPFSFGILEVADKRWFYDLRTPGEFLTDMEALPGAQYIRQSQNA